MVSKVSEGYAYDLVDITRQVLANYAQVLHQNIINAHQSSNQQAFEKSTKQFLTLIDDQDYLLSSIESLTLGNWLAEARSVATSKEEADLFEFNARTQITTWSFKNFQLT